VRPQVELALRLERANRIAAKAASDFTLALYDQKLTPGTPAFDAYLASRNISLKDIAPFTQENPPAELASSPEVARAAFKLNKDRPYSDVVPLPTGSVVLFWKETIPSRQPALAEVKTKVSNDYVESEKQKRFVELGKTIRSQLEARLKAGDSFEKAVAVVSSSSGAKIEQKTHAPFTLRQRPQDLDYLVLSTLDSLEKGGVSEMIVGDEKGLLVYAADKKAPDLSEDNPQYKAARTQLAQLTASRLGTDYLREMIDAELAKSKPAAK
jgi:peptidyl-prolyl cis-trans isomerase D